MGTPLSKVLADHSIRANQTIDKRLDGNGSQTNLRIGDDHSGLDHVPRHYLCFQSFIEDLEIEF